MEHEYESKRERRLILQVPQSGYLGWQSISRHWALLVLVLGFLFPALAKADSGSMTFRVAPLQTGLCGARCPHVIVADGIIETGTPQAFVSFLRASRSDANLRRIVFFNSRGGNVDASLVFGRILREQRITAVVGRFDGWAPDSGKCLSACVYAMMGAVKREVPPGSEAALHRMSQVETESGPWGGPTRVTRSLADPSMVAVLKHYTTRMGVKPALIGAAEALPPDTVHVLTPEEMRRWSFASDRDPEEAQDRQSLGLPR